MQRSYQQLRQLLLAYGNFHPESKMTMLEMVNNYNASIKDNSFRLVEILVQYIEQKDFNKNENL